MQLLLLLILFLMDYVIENDLRSIYYTCAKSQHRTIIIFYGSKHAAAG